jgi:hypothetical protein
MGDRGLVVLAGRRGAGEEVDLDLADAAAAELDVAGAQAVIEGAAAFLAEPREERTGDGARRALSERPCFGVPVLAQSPMAKTFSYLVSSVRGLTVIHPFSDMRVSSTTGGTRCFGTPRKRSNGI